MLQGASQSSIIRSADLTHVMPHPLKKLDLTPSLLIRVAIKPYYAARQLRSIFETVGIQPFDCAARERVPFKRWLLYIHRDSRFLKGRISSRDVASRSCQHLHNEAGAAPSKATDQQ